MIIENGHVDTPECWCEPVTVQFPSGLVLSRWHRDWLSRRFGLAYKMDEALRIQEEVRRKSA